MFAVNLKSLTYIDTFRVAKNVSCSVFGSNLRETLQSKNVLYRSFASKILQRNQIPIALRARINITPQRQESTKKAIPPSPVTYRSLMVAIVGGSLFLCKHCRPTAHVFKFFGITTPVYFNHLREKKLKQVEAYKNREIGKVKLGGKFDLVDQDNNPVTSDDLLGNWLLIYFGFTHCPDICPDELEKMVEVVNKLDEDKEVKGVKPVFITVDPERDSPGVIKKYLKEFSDKIIGLTGTVEQIAKVCKAYRVYFSPGPKDSDADYIVDHSIIMYLVDPEGKFIDFYGQNKDAQSIASSIRFNQLKHEHKKSFLEKVASVFSKE